MFSDDIIVYAENSKDPQKNLELTNESTKQQDTKSTYKNELHFSTLTLNNPKKKLKKQFNL